MKAASRSKSFCSLRLDAIELCLLHSVVLLVLVSAGMLDSSRLALAGSSDPYPPMFRDADVFLKAIELERPKQKPQASLTGITVPHHLLAADLMARGFWRASTSGADRVILLSPDHFHHARHAFATTPRTFQTVFGMVEPDYPAISSLLAQPELFEESNLFQGEHGIAALLPFVAHFFPKARIVPIVISPNAAKADWEQAISRLLPLVTSRTLVVQSTDFSHYLPSWIAQQRDQETLNVLSANSADQVALLVPSDHLDSRGAQYIQMRLQSILGAKAPIVIANRNASEYTHVYSNSTSYIVQLFSKAALDPGALQYPDQQVVYFGGDTFFGRYLTQPLIGEASRRAMFAEIRRATGGLPLIVNLEGVALDEVPEQLPDDRHAMPSGLAIPGLQAMNVVAASLANNHGFDLGAVGLDETLAALKRAGVQALQHGEIADLGKFRLVTLNFVSKRQIPGFPVVQDGELNALCAHQARPPLLAFVHWGTEYDTVAGDSEHAIARQMLDCGVAGIIGAHSHRASTAIEATRGGAQQITYSLGNLLFDQNGSIGSGAILELRVFSQGTFATRLLPIADVYDLGRGLLPGATGTNSEENKAN
jgi:AmmeMemoRadiSam system protein B